MSNALAPRDLIKLKSSHQLKFSSGSYRKIIRPWGEPFSNLDDIFVIDEKSDVSYTLNSTVIVKGMHLDFIHILFFHNR